ncbi:putative cytokinetic ring protein SteA [Corynebacterium sp. ES2794-CONJ1]|nr:MULTISPECIES: putative cytokinetic ring protein SteA [unclassified Corynebacterium]MCS4489411.1 putative cytokinetic ring protein SteA [Corynebacterium sp. ES2775-CONJ]MCS4530897.1 putative cytokinetic ring protein SteA [Corynebacterium sp. ES2730-CONJ]MCU9518262.1 putative cytokinetic ring protein SteA [Corynebacterium sp. ES2794-CONJ1]
MERMGLFSHSSDLPGLQGATRDLSIHGKGFKRLREGDIAVIDVADISRSLAQRLIDVKPAAVINSQRFSTGAIPNFGPQLLLDSGIMLVEATGAGIWENLKDGKKARLTDDGKLYYGERLIAAGVPMTMTAASVLFADAQQNLLDSMNAYFGNTIEFINSESPLLIDGLGIPEVGREMWGRKALVVSPGIGAAEQLASLKFFIREYEPVIIAVDQAADILVNHGYTPEYIVGDPLVVGNEALRCGARVILPADPDGHAVGLERIQDLGIGAMTFPSAVDSSTDLALLLADYHGAELVVSAGSSFSLDGLFAQAASANPAQLLTRAKLGPKLVDATAISSLYSVSGGSRLGWLWALLAFLVFAATVIVIAGFGGDASFTDNLVNTWNNIALSFQNLVKGQ